MKITGYTIFIIGLFAYIIEIMLCVIVSITVSNQLAGCIFFITTGLFLIFTGVISLNVDVVFLVVGKQEEYEKR